MNKIILLLLYPFAFIFHPKLRQYQVNRIKYWASDNDYLKEEFDGLSKLLLVGTAFYLLLFIGINFTYSTFILSTKKIGTQISETVYKINIDKNTSADDKEFFNKNIVAEVKTVNISEKEYKEHDKTINYKKEKEKNDNEFAELLRKAKAKAK